MRSITWFLSSLVVCSCCSLRPNSALAQADNDKKGTVVTIDGLQSQAPSTWVEERPTSRSRYKQFRLEPVKDDKEKAEMIISFFGAGSGGSAADNIKRWKGMFLPPEGKKIDDVAKVEEFKVGEVAVTYVDVSGTYLERFPPFDPNAKVTPRPNYRMVSVLFASEKGPYFFRLLGPADTVAHYKKGFDEWLKAFK